MMNETPTAEQFQEVALETVTDLLQIEGVTQLSQLDTPIDGVAPSGEHVRLQRSSWEVFELAHNFPSLLSARSSIGRVVDSVFLFLSREQRQKAEIAYSSEMVTDIRYDSADGQYRIRIYSPLTESKTIDDPGRTDIVEAVRHGLQDEGADNRMQLPPSSGFLVSIQKVSKASDSDEGTADSTDTFMAISIRGEDNPELNFRTLMQLVGGISKGIQQKLGIAPTRILSKIRTGASLSVDSGSAKARDDELLFAAYDSNSAEHNINNSIRSDGSVDLDAVWRSRAGEDFSGQVVPAEVEFNVQSHVVQSSNRANDAEMRATMASAFIDDHS